MAFCGITYRRFDCSLYPPEIENIIDFQPYHDCVLCSSPQVSFSVEALKEKQLEGSKHFGKNSKLLVNWGYNCDDHRSFNSSLGTSRIWFSHVHNFIIMGTMRSHTDIRNIIKLLKCPLWVNLELWVTFWLKHKFCKTACSRAL